MNNIFLWMVVILIIVVIIRLIPAFGMMSAKRSGKCTEFAIGILKETKVDKRSDTSFLNYLVEYEYEGNRVEVWVEEIKTEGFEPDTPAGSEVQLWYEPGKPKHVILADQQGMKSTYSMWRKVAKRLNVVLIVVTVICVVTWFL